MRTIRILLPILLLALAAFAQESTVKGALSGTVYDSTGAVIPGAKVMLSGAEGSKTATSDTGGNFLFPILTPGFYSVRVEKQGFKTSAVKAIEVATNKTSAIRLTMEPGVVSETVEVTANVATVDTSSAAVGTNLTDSFYSAIPAPRNVAGLFYVAPGAVSSGGAGASNPSISGGSGLENQYVADGVNITDGAFGGLGVFSRVYGALSSGINLSFVQEVQVKSAGFEPQYGKSTGGIVQIVTKSGGNQYHGTVGAYFAPQDLEATRLQPDLGGNDPSTSRFNLIGQVDHQAAYDVDGELGGYVPGFKDKLFFFGSFNPSWTRDYFQFSNFHGLPVTPGAPVGGLGPGLIKATAYNYAAKVTWKINENHTIEGSLFGDPTRTPLQNGTPGSAFALNTFSNTVDSKLSYGTRNAVVRYNGTLSPTWLVNANLSWGHNYISETPSDPALFGLTENINDPNNNTTPLPDPATNFTWDSVTPSPVNCAAHGNCVTTGGYTLQGHGFIENTAGDHYRFEVDTQKSFHFLGDHNFSIGYAMDRDFYDGSRFRTGGFNPFPATADAANIGGASAACAPANGGAGCLNAPGTVPVSVPPQLSGSPFGFDFGGQVRWAGPAVADPSLNTTSFPLWPLLDSTGTPFAFVPVRILQTRGEFGNPQFFTSGTYHAIYGMDSWSPWKYLTINAGIRWEQQRLQGTQDPSQPAGQQIAHYTWVGNWSPRIGVIVDPWGDRKTKISVNFGRYNYAVPLDMAIRSLSTELDIFSATWLPHWDGEPAAGGQCATNGINPATGNPMCGSLVSFNPDGTILNPTLTAGWLASTRPFTSTESQEAIASGTKMESLDEWTVGFEHDFGHGVIFSARYIDRRMKRIIEDMSGVSPEAANIGVVQQFTISNPNKKTDLFVNPIQVEGFDPVFLPDGTLDPNAPSTPQQCVGFDNFGLAPTGNPADAVVIYGGTVTNASGQTVLPGGTPTTGTSGTGLCVVPQFDRNGNPNYPNAHEPGDLASDGIPEGFPNPVRNYQAFELEVNKSFSRNWQIRSNYRLARLKGNYEGAFRNDNGQSDPSISSLFDFTAGDYNLLGDQFAIGSLNTDRRHVVNTYFSYLFDNTFLKGLTIGTGVRIQTGVPINDLRAHPVYLNAGEVPIGGRGSLGRLPTTGQVDVHLDYAMKLTERSKLHFGADLFNIANMKRQTNIDQFQDRSFGVANADFLNPSGLYTGFQRPFFARLMAKWEF